LRQEELIRQTKEDELFRKVMKVHQESIDTYLENVIGESVEDTATITAKLQAVEYASNMADLRTELESA
jgi:DNA-binding phage protein